jgi:enediyne biosynthesis protein E4
VRAGVCVREATIRGGLQSVLCPALLASLLVGCVPASAPSAAPEPAGDWVEFGPEIVCAEPYEGFDRLTEQANERGLDVAHVPPQDIGLPGGNAGGALMVQDLDGDGDLDIASVLVDGRPVLYENDGQGFFTQAPEPWDAWGGLAYMTGGQVAVDLDGDSLPEIVTAGAGRATIAWNRGDLLFDPPEAIYQVGSDSPDRAIYMTLSLADIDGAGDLDLALPGFVNVGGDNPGANGAPDLVLTHEDGDWQVTHALMPDSQPGMTFVGTFTDRDRDGDPDLYVASEGGHYGQPPSAFYRNDGPGPDGVVELVNDAPAIGAATLMSGMGIATWDLNGDGLLDYCLTDTGPIVCLLSDGGGGYYEGGAALGLIPQAAPFLMLWSIELADLDNDGVVDAVSAGGAPAEPELSGDQFQNQPDVIWQGARTGTALSFEDRSVELGFGDTEEHYALVTADLDGDGFLDVVTAPNDAPPRLWMNRCGPSGWLEVELVGPEGNAEGWGALLSVEIDGRVELQELQNGRAYGQGPSRFHVGVGEAEHIDALQLDWPDGEQTVLIDVPVRRRLTLHHPSRAQ